MEPREPTQPWPSGNVPTPAWTKTIDGAAYTIEPIDDDVFGIWRDVEELGSFRLDPSAPGGVHSAAARELSLEAQAAVAAFIETSREFPEGAATRS
jgi:hypothetical protein